MKKSIGKWRNSFYYNAEMVCLFLVYKEVISTINDKGRMIKESVGGIVYHLLKKKCNESDELI